MFKIDRLRRVTTFDRIIPEIDGLRFLAIISVVLFHLRTHLLRSAPFELSTDGPANVFFRLVSNGGFGVNIFFAISGFILALPFAGHHIYGGRRVNLKAYYLRRLTRLEPPYFIIMTLLLLLSISYMGIPAIQSLPHYFASLGYAHFFIYGEWSTINPVAWSLETEVQFYLLAPVVFMIFRVKNSHFRKAVMISVSVLFVIFYFVFIDHFIHLHLYKSLLAYLPYFATGILFADYYLSSLKRGEFKRSYLWDLTGLVSTFTAFWFNPNDGPLSSLILLFSLFLILTAAFKGRVMNLFYTRPFVFITGGMCYTIYLIHYAFIAFMMNFTSIAVFNGSLIMNMLLQALIILPLLFLVSAALFLLIEKPFMQKDWPKKVRLLLTGRSESVTQSGRT
jgi:peptidoglycan/LPS O-acetylase OafA/YrhL